MSSCEVIMDKKTENELNKALQAKMQEVRDSALLAGSKAICGVVLNKAKDKRKTNHEKLIDIIDFCERSLGVVEKHKEN